MPPATVDFLSLGTDWGYLACERAYQAAGKTDTEPESQPAS